MEIAWLSFRFHSPRSLGINQKQCIDCLARIVKLPRNLDSHPAAETISCDQVGSGRLHFAYVRNISCGHCLDRCIRAFQPVESFCLQPEKYLLGRKLRREVSQIEYVSHMRMHAEQRRPISPRLQRDKTSTVDRAAEEACQFHDFGCMLKRTKCAVRAGPSIEFKAGPGPGEWTVWAVLAVAYDSRTSFAMGADYLSTIDHLA